MRHFDSLWVRKNRFFYFVYVQEVLAYVECVFTNEFMTIALRGEEKEDPEQEVSFWSVVNNWIKYSHCSVPGVRRCQQVDATHSHRQIKKKKTHTEDRFQLCTQTNIF